MLRFFSIPAWRLVDTKTPSNERLEPELPASMNLQTLLADIEYRGDNAYTRALDLLEPAKPQAVYARSPNDLPALLRTADQLLMTARRDLGERALVTRCECGARFAVPLSLVRPVTVRCENCKKIVDLDSSKATETTLHDKPEVREANLGRRALADFFREAMARGWPVMVSQS